MRNTFIALSLLGVVCASCQEGHRIVVSNNSDGREFEGVGALSAGASTRLLFDYDQRYQEEILDYLFKPMYGASLQHLKVEIGGDVNSTCGTEPSHARKRGDDDFTRGYEWTLMKEAKKRNERIVLDALQWGAPFWIGDGKFYSQDNADFIARFVEGAKKEHGLTIDYVGVWNETPYDTAWIKTLARTLRSRNLSAKIVGADEVCSWNIANDMVADSELFESVDVIGTHYPPNGSTSVAQETGKSLWASEEGATMRDHWDAAKHIIRRFNRGYIDGKIVKQIVWSVTGSYYDILPVPESGLLNARTPWSGQYELKPVLWAIAHYTQFVQPGWRYIDQACGYTEDKNCSYVVLKHPTAEEYSVIVEAVDAEQEKLLDFELPTNKSFHVWETSAREQFVRRCLITPRNGKFSFKVNPGSIYSLTTTTGQRKGNQELVKAGYKAFPFPYKETFECYPDGRQPRYLSDQAGVFEVVTDARQGKILQQTIAQRGIEWLYHVNPLPHSFIGDTTWTDYTVKADIKLSGKEGTGVLYGRLNAMYQHTITDPVSYWVKLDGRGNWILGKTLPALYNGHYDFKNEWPEFYQRFNDRNQSLQLSTQELRALPEERLNQFPKVKEYLEADGDSATIFLECLYWGIYDVRRDTPLAKGKIALDVSSWQNLQLSFNGQNISVMLNGQELARVTDESHTHGMVGIGSCYSETSFDNLEIY